MYRFFEGIPEVLMEAAPGWRGRASAFVRVGLPLGSPGVVSAMVLGFLEYWNLIEQPMAFLKTMENWPLSLFLPNIGAEQAAFAFCGFGDRAASGLLVFLAGQDYLEQGIISTAVKE